MPQGPPVCGHGTAPKPIPRARHDRHRATLGPEALQQLPYTKAVTHQTIRLRPAGVFSPRQAKHNIAIDPRTIRKGSFILLCPYLAGHDAS